MERRQNEELLEARRLRRQEQKRRLLMRQRVLAVVLLVIVILSLILILRGCRNRREHPELYVKKDSALELQTEPDATVNIAAVGDIMITDDLLADAKQPDGSYQFAESFAAVSGYTLSADFTIGNLECNFCGEPYAGKPDYRAPDSLATTLSTIGFDLLQTANTCSIQNGLSGLQSTIDTLTNAGIDHAGTYTSEAERTQNGGVVLKTVSGMKIAIVAYTKGLGGLQLPEGAEYAVNLLYKDYSTDYNKLDMSALLGSVDAAKSLKPDIILVMLHWGSEATLEPTKTQESIAKQLFERGADAIIGSHSHLVGRMETMDITTDDGKEKTCFVAYSLGNFFSSQDSSYASGCESSVILNLQFTKNGETGETALTSVNYTPLYLMDRGSGADGAQYEILPIRTAIASGLFPDDTQTLTDAISSAADELDSILREVHAFDDVTRASCAMRDRVLPQMSRLRAVCDEAETLTARSFWPFPTYDDLLFGLE